MAKFLAKDFLKVCKDIDGVDISYDLPPTREEIKEAIKEGKNLVPKQEPLTVQIALKRVLKADLSVQTGQGTIPDPHQDKKYEIYVLLGKISALKDTEDEVILESEDISIIKERAKKFYFVEVYGFLHNFLEGKI
jgi:hypothetical protein